MYAKRTLRTFGVLAPLAVVVFGWPFAGKYLVNLSNGVYASSAPRSQGRGSEEREERKSHKIARRAMLQQGPERLDA